MKNPLNSNYVMNQYKLRFRSIVLEILIGQYSPGIRQNKAPCNDFWHLVISPLKIMINLLYVETGAHWILHDN